MAKIPTIFAYLHHLFLSVPQHGYHNISRVMQPQMRCIGESFRVPGLQLNASKKPAAVQSRSNAVRAQKGKKAPSPSP